MSLSVRALLIAALFLYPLIYFGMFAGDAEIHLVYGANAAAGAFFEFNRGETSPGVTSPGFMLLVGALFRVLPAAVVPLAIKVLCLVAWYGLCFVVFLLARRFGLRGGWAWVACCVAGLIPGSAYNATIGMESGVFALAACAWLYAALVSGWFETGAEKLSGRTWWNEALLGGAIGAATWVRPEGVVIGALASAYRAFYFIRSGTPLPQNAARTLAFLIPFCAVTGIAVAFHFAYTGYLIPSSGRARVLMGSLDAFWMGPVPFNTNVLIRLFAYFPLTLTWMMGVRLVINRSAVPATAQAAAEFSVLLAGTVVVLYSTVLGSHHLARYLVFVLPLVALVATIGARWLWEQPSGRTAVIMLALALGGVFTVETRARLQLGGSDELARAMAAPSQRNESSSELFAALGSPQELPIVVAWADVQWRYWLDDRFVVRSLDGRTDPLMLEFVRPGHFDHVAYIKARGIRFLMELPNYNRDSTAWSLQELEKLAPFERLVHDGLVFSRVGGDSDIIRVEPVR
ncbi:MAG: hypothetical protein IPL75_02670 [Acidobacteria bacterium]|nr:hypothetical protein [Acidobacteriota bacterium]